MYKFVAVDEIESFINIRIEAETRRKVRIEAEPRI